MNLDKKFSENHLSLKIVHIILNCLFHQIRILSKIFLYQRKLKCKKSTWVTQIPGSVTGKMFCRLYNQSIKDKKEKELQEKETRKKQKKIKEKIFFSCKEECLFEDEFCAAVKLKECPS